MQIWLLTLLIFGACHSKETKTKTKTELPACHEVPKRFGKTEMIKINAKKFLMGTNAKESYASERPAHMVEISSFWIDVTEVTNQEFMEFVKQTNYLSVAERKPEWKQLKKQLPPGVPEPDAATLVPASLVFTPPSGEVDLNQMTWWKWVPGASWKTPTGPGSNLDKLMNHPVTHVALEDAQAYCQWKKKRLPTEAEWELAARGEGEPTTYAWGNEFKPQGKFMANTFQGEFPKKNLGEDGYAASAEVGRFPPNANGLFDMIGNVWEWTSDFYDENYYASLKTQKIAANPRGPKKSYDPQEPYAIKHVIKGGSFLCADNYCVNYRPSARLGAAFDSGASHIGFRCVKR